MDTFANNTFETGEPFGFAINRSYIEWSDPVFVTQNITGIDITLHDTSEQQIKRIDYTVNRSTGAMPLTVQFSDNSTGDMSAWFWDFGDGTNSTLRNPVHTYVQPGNYTVTFEIYDSWLMYGKEGYIDVFGRGDFNGNGRVDIGDVTRVAYMVVGLTPVDYAADFDGSGLVNVGDAAKIAWYYVGKVPVL